MTMMIMMTDRLTDQPNDHNHITAQNIAWGNKIDESEIVHSLCIEAVTFIYLFIIYGAI